jgi:hypothetical protein
MIVPEKTILHPGDICAPIYLSSDKNNVNTLVNTTPLTINN